MPEAKRLYLIDGYSTIFRAFYALPNLSNSKGQPTNAAFGFAKMLGKLLRERSPDLIGIALDTGRKTFRSEKFAEYKANRAPMPDDLRSQLSAIRETIAAYRIPILEQHGFEADDVLGTLARKARDRGYSVVLVTPDKDLMQLVGPGVTLYHTMRDEEYDAKGVEASFGVPPDKVADVLALMGDTVDNVPGVPGIGEKGAKNLILEYGSVENLLEHAGEIKRKSYREGLTENRDQALLSKELTTIATDCDVAFDPQALGREEPDAKALYQLFRELEFFSLLEELEAAGIEARREVAPARLCESPQAWAEIAEQQSGAIVCALIGPVEQAVGLALCAPSGDDTHGDGAADVILADFRTEGLCSIVRASLVSWLGEEGREVVGHDLKELLRFAWAPDSGESDLDARPALRAQLLDTMLLAYLLPSALRSFELENVAFERLHSRPMKLEDAGFVKGQPPMPGHEGLRLLASERASMIADLRTDLEATLAGERGEVAGDPRGVYQRIEEPLIVVLERMEERGIELDVDFLHAMSRGLGGKIDGLEEEIYKIAGEHFNINSSQQLGALMFEKLGYPILKRTRKTKSYSTSAETLEELAARGYDLPERLIAYRELTKLRSTYVDAFPELVSSDGRLHTRYYQAVAATGRLSSANPNLQNIPVRTDVGQEIRKAFRAARGYLLLVADYSQIELRVLAHIAQEQTLIEIFERGGDVHRETAAAMFGGSAELVSDQQRRVAKMINFGIIYGMGAFGLSQRLGIETKEAARFIESYFERFPGVRSYTDETLERAKQTGYVETLYGRCRFLPDINSRNFNLRENAKRMAINARIQGTAADLLKLAMIAVERRLADEHPEARLLLTVHDELVVEVPEASMDAVRAAVVGEMEGVAELTVPLRVDVGMGETWWDAKG